MEENIRTRKRIFEKILMLEGTDNKRNWEMLCSSGKSLVPFIGAGRKIPEYQRYFPILFPHILVTTN